MEKAFCIQMTDLTYVFVYIIYIISVYRHCSIDQKFISYLVYRVKYMWFTFIIQLILDMQ